MLYSGVWQLGDIWADWRFGRHAIYVLFRAYGSR